VTENRLSNYD